MFGSVQRRRWCTEMEVVYGYGGGVTTHFAGDILMGGVAVVVASISCGN